MVLSKEVLRRILNPLKHSIQSMVTRGLIKIVKDSHGIQVVQVTGMAEEVLDDVERIQNYGVTSNPPKEAEAILLSVMGRRGNTVVIACDDRTVRVKNLESGATCVYDNNGNAVLLDSNGITLTSPTKVTVDAPDAEFTGKLHAAEVSDEFGSLKEYSVHVHSGSDANGVAVSVEGPQAPPE